MIQNMPKEQMMHICHKMYHRRNLLLRAFAINLGLIIFVWILSMSGWFAAMAGHLMHCGAENAETYVLHLLGAWKVANIAFFFAPALAAWWEMRCYRAYYMEKK